MLTIEMCARDWNSAEDFYIELLPKLGAPSWHGHNLDAINDSVFGGDINQIEPPFRIVITCTAEVDSDLQAYLSEVQKIFNDGRHETSREAFIDIV